MAIKYACCSSFKTKAEHLIKKIWTPTAYFAGDSSVGLLQITWKLVELK